MLHSDDERSVVTLNGFQIELVNIRDEAPFERDAMAAEKGRGMYIYVLVDDIDNTYSRLQKNGITPYTEPKTGNGAIANSSLRIPMGINFASGKRANDEQY